MKSRGSEIESGSIGSAPPTGLEGKTFGLRPVGICLVVIFSLVQLSISPAAGETKMGDLTFSARKDFRVGSVEVDGNATLARGENSDLADPFAFGQAFSCDLKGSPGEGVYTEFFYDDAQEEKIKRLFLEARHGDFFSTAGDLSLDFGDREFALKRKDIRGISVGTRSGSKELRAFTSRVKGRTERDAIEGNFSKGPYILNGGAIVPGSEILELDGRILERNMDYAIDYTSGILSFTRNLARGAVVFAGYDLEDKAGEDRTLDGLTGSMPMGKNARTEVTVLRKRDSAETAESIGTTPMEHTVINLHQAIDLGRLEVKAELAKSSYDLDSTADDAVIDGSAYRFSAGYDAGGALVGLKVLDLGTGFRNMDKTSADPGTRREILTLEPRLGKNLRSRFEFERGESNLQYDSYKTMAGAGNSDRGVEFSFERRATRPVVQAGSVAMKVAALPGETTTDRFSLDGNYAVSRALRFNLEADGYGTGDGGDGTLSSDQKGLSLRMQMNASPSRDTRITATVGGREDDSSGGRTGQRDAEMKVKFQLPGGYTVKATGRYALSSEFTVTEDPLDGPGLLKAVWDAPGDQEEVNGHASVVVSTRPVGGIDTSLTIARDTRSREGGLYLPVDGLRDSAIVSMRYRPDRNLTFLTRLTYRDGESSDPSRMTMIDEKGVDLSLNYQAMKHLRLKGEFGIRDNGSGSGTYTTVLGATCRISDRFRLSSDISLGEPFGGATGESRLRGDVNVDYRIGESMDLTLEMKVRRLDSDIDRTRDYEVKSGNLRMTMKI